MNREKKACTCSDCGANWAVVCEEGFDGSRFLKSDGDS